MSPAAFDPHDFPHDLLDAQRALTALNAQLRALQARLPSVVPGSGPRAGGGEGAGTASPRAAGDGWTADDAAEYDRLWAELRTAATAVGPVQRSRRRRTRPRRALKHADGAEPVNQDAVTTAA
ncbi:hypothetical protein OG317_36855 [Streptomyces sp. NBC_01167]|uniref:hypothetical protein n=1 Tax=Streptomyces sp. NBC_01167 TaxID=2903756 RepID=UPI0038701562|nr:hypothetical protein OG317_36855 [Streptomyces sp. NBC_01167]